MDFSGRSLLPALPLSAAQAYPEAVLVAVDVEVLYDDLGAVPDLPAAVSAQGLAGPGESRERVDFSVLLWLQSQHCCQGFIPATSTAVPTWDCVRDRAGDLSCPRGAETTAGLKIQ